VIAKDWPPDAIGGEVIPEDELEVRLLLRRLSKAAGDIPLRSDPRDPVNQQRLAQYMYAKTPPTADAAENEPRNEKGEWVSGGGGGDVVEHHKARLTAALAEPKEFEKAFAAIQKLDTPTLTKLARDFSGVRATSRADALRRIMARHANLMAAKAKIEFMRGRSAG
jgi:hypothetical protein